MRKDQFNCQCLQVRQAFDEKVKQQHEFLQEHFKECISCAVWSEVTRELAEAGSRQPCFDVPEATTQNILKAVAEARAEHKEPQYALLLCCAIASLMGLFAVALAETPEGICSWFVCAIILIGFKLIANSANGSVDLRLSQ